MLHSKPASDDAAARLRAPSRTRGLARTPAFIPGIVETPDASAALAERILQSFNTWAFKREQPDSPALLRQSIGCCVSLNASIPFVLYWGKGPRGGVSAPETACLDYLNALARRICAVYEPGATIRLIFTDTHARLNGHPEAALQGYFASVAEEARKRGFDTCYLGDLVRKLETMDALAASANDLPDAQTLLRLTECAAKWYRGEGGPDQGASEYFRMNMVEKRAVACAFPQAIFVTFNGSEFRSLFPDDLPIFYMYSIRRGVGAKPWFLPDRPA